MTPSLNGGIQQDLLLDDERAPARARGAADVAAPTANSARPIDPAPAPLPAPPAKGSVQFVRLDQLHDGAHRLRRAAAPASVEALAADMTATGHITPLTVRRRPSRVVDGGPAVDDAVETVLGHRRADALRLTQARARAHDGDAAVTPQLVPVVVVDADDVDALSLALVESKSHERLTPLDYAHGVAQLAAALETAGRPAAQRALGERLRASPATVNGALKIAGAITEKVLVAAGYRSTDGAFDASQTVDLTRDTLIEAADVEDVSERIAVLAARRRGPRQESSGGDEGPLPLAAGLSGAASVDGGLAVGSSTAGESRVAPAIANPTGRSSTGGARTRAERPSDPNALYAALKGGARRAERPRRSIPALTEGQAAVHLARVAAAAAVLSERAHGAVPVVELDPGGGGVVLVIAGPNDRSAEDTHAVVDALRRLVERLTAGAPLRDA